MLTLTWLIFFIKPLLGIRYTGWDTHDMGFVNFLFFSDSIREGIIPFWNPFIQSGIFFPNFNNVGLFYPFQLFFVILSWVINPLYAYELLIQASIMLGGAGAFKCLKSFGVSEYPALFGGIAVAISVLLPMTGQLGILISLSSFCWLIYACNWAINKNSYKPFSILFFATIAAMYLASGYLWMNIINLLIGIAFSSYAILSNSTNIRENLRLNKKVATLNIATFMGLLLILYAVTQLPGYLNLLFNYGQLYGDYISPEPRLRSLMAHDYFSYMSIVQAVAGSIDPRLIMNSNVAIDIPKWSWGSGVILWITLLITQTKKNISHQKFWFSLFIISILYSSAKSNILGELIKILPVINANRWWYIGINYAIISTIFIACQNISSCLDEKLSTRNIHIRSYVLVFITLAILLYLRSPIIVWLFTAAAFLILIYLLKLDPISKTTKSTISRLLIALTAINVISFFTLPHTGINWPPRFLSKLENIAYYNNVINRNKGITITSNQRDLGGERYYVYNNEAWLTKKIPTSHGYNNLGNPYYWYLKDEPYMANIFNITRDVRVEPKFSREKFDSDNRYVETRINDVLLHPNKPSIDEDSFIELKPLNIFKSRINLIHITPNTASINISINESAYIVFNTTYQPGWSAYVNGRPAKLARVNQIFQGILVKEPGNHTIQFKFEPTLAILSILTPYFALLVLIGFAMFQLIRKKVVGSV
jgi:hypothetical protein